jgi:hypothetical protein
MQTGGFSRWASSLDLELDRLPSSTQVDTTRV